MKVRLRGEPWEKGPPRRVSAGKAVSHFDSQRPLPGALTKTNTLAGRSSGLRTAGSRSNDPAACGRPAPSHRAHQGSFLRAWQAMAMACAGRHIIRLQRRVRGGFSPPFPLGPHGAEPAIVHYSVVSGRVCYGSRRQNAREFWPRSGRREERAGWHGRAVACPWGRRKDTGGKPRRARRRQERGLGGTGKPQLASEGMRQGKRQRR